MCLVGGTRCRSENCWVTTARSVDHGSSVNDFVTVYWSPYVSLRSVMGPQPVWQDFLTPMIDWVESNVKPDRSCSSYPRVRRIRPSSKTRPTFPIQMLLVTQALENSRRIELCRECPDVTVYDNYVWLGRYNFTANIELWCRHAAIGGGIALPLNAD